MRRAVSSLVIVVAVLVHGAAARAAPDAELWPRWQAHEPDSTATIDHAAWGRFIETYLVQGDDGVNLLAYADVTPSDRAALDAYLAMLSEVAISRYDRDQQMAYWINLYNALTVQVVLDHYPVDSIRDIDISPGWFSDGPWGAELIAVEGEDLTLDDIEHRILRPIWQDPRIHYAVNCAAWGCPNLQPEPYRGGVIDRQLDAAAKEYVNHPRGVAIEEGELIVSSIYIWFQEDFGGTDEAVIDHLIEYAEPALAARLDDFVSIDDDRYDWSLNDATRG